jgi:hypothetical protein
LFLKLYKWLEQSNLDKEINRLRDSIRDRTIELKKQESTHAGKANMTDRATGGFTLKPMSKDDMDMISKLSQEEVSGGSCQG